MQILKLFIFLISIACEQSIYQYAYAEEPFQLESLAPVAQPIALRVQDNCIELHFLESKQQLQNSSLRELTTLSIAQHKTIEFTPLKTSITSTSIGCDKSLEDLTGTTLHNLCTTTFTVCSHQLKDLDNSQPFVIASTTTLNNTEQAHIRLVDPTVNKLIATKISKSVLPSKKSDILILPLRVVSLNSVSARIEASPKSQQTIQSWVTKINQIWNQCGIFFKATETWSISNPYRDGTVWPYLLYSTLSTDTFSFLSTIANSIAKKSAQKPITVLLGNPLIIDFPISVRGFAIGHPIITQAVRDELGLDGDNFKNFIFASDTMYVTEPNNFNESTAKTTAHEIGHLLVSHRHSDFESLMSVNHASLKKSGTKLTIEQCKTARFQAQNFN